MGEPHWSFAAQAAVRAIILMVLTLTPKDRNLVTVRDLLTLTHPMVRDWAARLKLTEQQALITMMENIGDKLNSKAS